jgi:hypothetical protein
MPIGSQRAETREHPSDEPFLGWRSWIVLKDEGLLRPLTKKGLVWPARKAYEAICAERYHLCPAPMCSCGIYATFDLDALSSEHQWSLEEGEVRVTGQVALWGRVQVHSHGCRAQFGYPKTLYTLNETIAGVLREKYGVAVESVERTVELFDYLSTDRSRKPVTAPPMTIDQLRRPRGLSASRPGTWRG